MNLFAIYLVGRPQCLDKHFVFSSSTISFCLYAFNLVH